ncbi:cathepsin L1 [Pelomyxa schiedti]|nr:cathepsin L1 [Pelomyxa schiedti]
MAMTGLYIVFALFIGASLALDSPKYTLRAFDDWAARFERHYATHSEWSMRFAIWRHNAMWVEKFNAAGGATYTVEMNQFGDLTDEEFRSIYLRLLNGTIFPSPTTSSVPSRRDPDPKKDYKDWTDLGVVTPVKDQGHCGSCWAFSTTGAIEAFWALNKGKLISLSEQQLVDCAKSCHGCNGGWMDSAFQYVINMGGIESEDDYPYKGASSLCEADKTKYKASIPGFKDIASGNEKLLQDTIVKKQPCSVAIDASQPGFRYYKDGIYQDKDCSTTHLNHGVLAVGFDADASKHEYIKVKNSWGTGWGDKGYIKMAANINCCGIATAASYPSEPNKLFNTRQLTEQ